MEGSDVCFAAVLSMSEGANHPHNKTMKTFIENRRDSTGGSGS